MTDNSIRIKFTVLRTDIRKKDNTERKVQYDVQFGYKPAKSGVSVNIDEITRAAEEVILEDGLPWRDVDFESNLNSRLRGYGKGKVYDFVIIADNTMDANADRHYRFKTKFNENGNKHVNLPFNYKEQNSDTQLNIFDDKSFENE